MQQANSMSDLQYLKENFSGSYVSRMPLDYVLHHVSQDPEYPEEIRALIARGLERFYLGFMPNSDVLLVDHNSKMIRFPINTLLEGFWFTNFVCQSIARYGDYTLTIEMISQGPTARKVIYQFRELPQGRKDVKIEMFNGTTSWQMTYDKID